MIIQGLSLYSLNLSVFSLKLQLFQQIIRQQFIYRIH
jgi:hypothetical protein